MSDWPLLVILLLTYNRLEYAKRTLESTLRLLSYPGHFHLHIASDGDTAEYLTELKDLALSYISDMSISMTNVYQKGYGASYNAATQVIHLLPDPRILVLEDDWELQHRLDLIPMVNLLHHGDIGCIRMGYLGYTQDLIGKMLWREKHHWLELHPNSPERHIFAGHPRLETVGFQRNVGPWIEGLPPGATEFEVSGRPESRRGVVWPVDLIRPTGDAFFHIGTQSFGKEASTTLMHSGGP